MRLLKRTVEMNETLLLIVVDVPVWLKGLRLHKYSHLFSLMSYEEMLSLTEEQLELQGVTKGARHKIALSIIRLRERPTLLAQLEKVNMSILALSTSTRSRLS